METIRGLPCETSPSSNPPISEPREVSERKLSTASRSSRSIRLNGIRTDTGFCGTSLRNLAEQQPTDLRTARSQRAETLHGFSFQPIDQAERDPHRHRFLRDFPKIEGGSGSLHIKTFRTRRRLSHRNPPPVSGKSNLDWLNDDFTQNSSGFDIYLWYFWGIIEWKEWLVNY